MSYVTKTGRKAKPWRAVIDDPEASAEEGRRVTHSQSFRRQSDAKAHMDQAEGSKVEGTWVSPTSSAVLFRDRWEIWLAGALNQRDSTKDREEATCRSLILPTFGDTPLDDITFDSVEKWVTELSGAGYAAASIKKAHQVLSRVLKHAVLAKVLRANPAAGVRLPKIELEIQRLLTDAEIAALSAELDEGNRLWFLLSVFGGLRAEESFALRVRHIDRTHPEIDIVETVVETGAGLVWGKPKTKNGKRRIEIPGFIWEALLAHVEGHRPDELVFPATRGGAVHLHNFRSRIWYKANVKAGLAHIAPCERIASSADTCKLCKPGTKAGAKNGHYVGPNIHDLRHTAVSMWIAEGANVLQVSQRAGHSKVSFTLDRYGHLFPGADDPTMGKLDARGRNLLGLPQKQGLRAVS